MSRDNISSKMIVGGLFDAMNFLTWGLESQEKTCSKGCRNARKDHTGASAPEQSVPNRTRIWPRRRNTRTLRDCNHSVLILSTMSRIRGPHASRCLHDAAGTEILRNGGLACGLATDLDSVLFGAGLAAVGLTAAFGRPTGFATGFATGSATRLAGPFAVHEELEESENKPGENSGMSSARGITGTPALEALGQQMADEKANSFKSDDLKDQNLISSDQEEGSTLGTAGSVHVARNVSK